MGKPLRKILEARDLPLHWQEEGRLMPHERVVVTIEPTDPELSSAADIEAVMDIISRRAEARGLTEETLEHLLDQS